MSLGRAWPSALAALAAACIQDIQAPARTDGAASLDAAGAADGAASLDAAGAADGAASVDAAASLDAAVSRDAEPNDGGSAAGLRWGEMVLPTTARTITALWGRAQDELYAASSNGFLYRSDGAGEWQQVWRTDNNQGIAAMVGDADRLYVVGENTAWAVRLADMTVVSALRAQSRQMYAVVPRAGGPEMFVGLEEQSGGVIARWTGASITVLHQPTQVRAVTSAISVAPETYLFGGTGGSIHGFISGAFAREVVSLPSAWSLAERAGTTMWGLGEVAGQIYAVGSAHLVWVRGGSVTLPTWTVVHQGVASPDDEALYAIAGGARAGGGVEAFAVGDAPRTGGIVRFDGVRWAPEGVTDQWVLRSVWRVSEDLYFAGGYRRNGIDGVLVRGLR